MILISPLIYKNGMLYKKQIKKTNKTQVENSIKNNTSYTFLGNSNYGNLGKLLMLNACRINFKGIEKKDDKYPKHSLDNYAGCILGGAIGDALGAPVEFMSLAEIKNKYGKNGIQDLELNEYGQAEFTDDTQMTMFTAEGLIKSVLSGRDLNDTPNYMYVYESYLNWYNTQFKRFKPTEKGMLVNTEALYQNRSPGFTCIRSLKEKEPGSIEEPINNSKGCGGVMRVAPVGLMYYKNPKLAFEVGAQCAALTHGSPYAYLPAGVLSSLIANIIQGKNINEALDNSIEILKEYEYHTGTLAIIEKARNLAKSNIESEEAIQCLGEGWNGDEALAIAIYCILKSENNYKNALIMSVNHNGDSDSTGAITGNIMGAYLGANAIPLKWKNEIELPNLLTTVTQDFYVKPNMIDNSNKRYVF